MNQTAMPTLPRLQHPALNRLRARSARLRWWWFRRRLGTGKRTLDLLPVAPALAVHLGWRRLTRRAPVRTGQRWSVPVTGAAAGLTIHRAMNAALESWDSHG